MPSSRNRENENKYQFLLRNLLRGFVLLAVFVLAFVLFRKFAGTNYQHWFTTLDSSLVFGVYVFSEVFFGIIPPEVFMAWGLGQGDTQTYINILLALMFISYGAGYFNYLLGRLLRKVAVVRWLMMKRMQRSTKYLNQFGGFLLIVAATTPLPFAAICFLVGTTKYSQPKFLLFTLFRLARYAAYGYVVWKAGGI